MGMEENQQWYWSERNENQEEGKMNQNTDNNQTKALGKSGNDRIDGAEPIAFQTESLLDFDGCNKSTIRNGMIHQLAKLMIRNTADNMQKRYCGTFLPVQYYGLRKP